MVLSVGCSRCGGTSSRRQPAFRRQASCRSGSLPRAVRRRQTSRSEGAAADGIAPRQGWRDDRDRGGRCTHPGGARSGAGDAFDRAIGASGHPLIALRSDLKVVVAAQPVDFRKSVHTLSALVNEALRANPYCGDVFVFRSKRADRVKLLAWDGSGMVLVTKWLHQGHFTWPPIRDGVVHLSATQLAMLVDGLEWTRVSPKPVKQPAVVG